MKKIFGILPLLTLLTILGACNDNRSPSGAPEKEEDSHQLPRREIPY